MRGRLRGGEGKRSTTSLWGVMMLNDDVLEMDPFGSLARLARGGCSCGLMRLCC